MPNELQCEQPKDEMKRDEREALDNLIREQVIQALGRPIDLRHVQVRKVWKNHYRVNVIVGERLETTVPGKKTSFTESKKTLPFTSFTSPGLFAASITNELMPLLGLESAPLSGAVYWIFTGRF